jgi:hypothetical protein
LANFTEKGNGLLVIGGVNSYDRGNYKSSYFETLLPVRIGRGDKKQGDSNIVILLDMSGSTQNYWTEDSNGVLVEVKDTKPLDVIKALAIDVIETLNMGNRVGVIAFAIQDVNDADKTKFKAVKVTDLDSLSNIKEKAVDKISRIAVPGQSLFDVGLAGAYTMIKHETGSRNVIMISDGGRNIYQTVKDNGLKNVQLMAEQGIRTYTVGVGRDVDEDYLKTLAEAGNGLYFPAGQENRLKILFGTPEEKKQGDEMELFILNPTHFITRELELDAKIYGFNQVVPKSLARVLITTDSGEPALVEWRYGLGKVISLTVFSGDAGLGQLLNQKNSKLLTNSINYLIGDPERKQEYNVIIPDTYINEITPVQVTSKEYPKASIDLTKIKDNYYEGKLKPTQLGFSKEMNTLYAVNSPKEYQYLGMYSNAQKIIQSTGGKVFSKENPDQIADYIKTVSKRSKIVKTYITWPILILLMIVYLFEVGLRKIIENRKTV